VAAYDKGVARCRPDRRATGRCSTTAHRLERSHQWPRAEADFQKALELSPEQPFVLNYPCYSWTEMGHNLPQARQMLDRAVDLRRTTARWWTARWCTGAGNVASGVKRWRRRSSWRRRTRR